MTQISIEIQSIFWVTYHQFDSSELTSKHAFMANSQTVYSIVLILIHDLQLSLAFISTQLLLNNTHYILTLRQPLPYIIKIIPKFLQSPNPSHRQKLTLILQSRYLQHNLTLTLLPKPTHHILLILIRPKKQPKYLQFFSHRLHTIVQSLYHE